MSKIHPTALVDPAAKLADDVRIGAYCVVGPQVELASGVSLQSHVVVQGRARLGQGCQVYPFAAVGTAPQDLKFDGEDSEIVIGENTIIREHVTLHPGTQHGGMQTRVGAGCLLMVGAHVAHDCRVGDGVIMANQATLGGHVVVEDNAFLGGLSAVHQFARIGRGAMIGGMTGVEGDVIPYGMVTGNRAQLNGLNIIGLKRRGVARSEVQALRAAYRALFDVREQSFTERLAEVEEEYGNWPTVRNVLDFIKTDSSRSLCQPHSGNAA